MQMEAKGIIQKYPRIRQGVNLADETITISRSNGNESYNPKIPMKKTRGTSGRRND